MASEISTEKVFANQAIAMFLHVPNSTNATIVSPDAGTNKIGVDLRDFGNFAALAMLSAKTGNGITKFEIVASATADFAAVTVVKDSGVVAADALADYVALECSAEEVRQLGADLRYVAGRLTLANSSDRAVVTYIRSTPRFAKSALTANYIS
jgi:hypothetical protein